MFTSILGRFQFWLIFLYIFQIGLKPPTSHPMCSWKTAWGVPVPSNTSRRSLSSYLSLLSTDILVIILRDSPNFASSNDSNRAEVTSVVTFFCMACGLPQNYRDVCGYLRNDTEHWTPQVWNRWQNHGRPPKSTKSGHQNQAALIFM